MTSEQFADEMLKDMESGNPMPSFAEQLAQMEQRINERIKETESSIFAKVDALATPEKTTEEVTEITPDTESGTNETIETISEREDNENEDN